jgi:hypothetical protein
MGRPASKERGLGFHPAPPFLRPTLPHLWAGPPNFDASIEFTARPAQRLKNHWGSINFFLQPQIQLLFFSLKGPTLAHLLLKFQNFIHNFDAMRELPKNPFWNFGPLGIKGLKFEVLYG